MPLSADQRALLIEVRKRELAYVSFATEAVADAKKAGVPVAPDIHYSLLAAAVSALDQDSRDREVRATMVLAGVVAVATAVQAAAALLTYLK